MPPSLSRLAILIGAILTLAGSSAVSHSAGETHTPLGEEMELMAKSLRTLRRQIADAAKKDASLKLLDEMEKNALKARDLIPAKAKDVAEADREKFVAAYQIKIDELAEALRKIAAEVREGRFDQAKEALGRLQALKRKGHEEFSAEKEEE